MESAECAGLDPDLMFPGRGDFVTMRAAKAVCAECVVKEECLEYALVNNESHGVWGGESEKARRRIKSERRSLRLIVTEE